MRLADLVHAHVGRAAFVLGGGPRLPEQFKQCPATAVRVSANYHGCLLDKCDYAVTQEMVGEAWELMRGRDALIVMPRPEADYQIECARMNTSGMEATRVAWVMGCAPIILAGMDCYQDPIEHWHRPDVLYTYGRVGKPPQPMRRLDKQLKAWGDMAAALPGAMLRPVSGPLAKIFRQYDAREVAAPIASADTILRSIGG